MPAFTTPTFTEEERELDRIGNGNGRLPPPDKYTGGNGEGDSGDDWDARPVGSRGPRERLSQVRVGLSFALGGDLLFFVGLIAAFLITRGSGHIDAYNRYINPWLPTKLPTILWLNTAALLLSSLTGEAARRSMFREDDVMAEWFGVGRPTSQRAAKWLWATLALGTLFVAGQWAAWMQLAAQGVFYASNPSSHFFYLLTAIHAAHLVLGLTAVLFALRSLYASPQIATRQLIVDGSIWYWHAMGVLWIALFALLEWCQ
jgi:cytochrome c oxidase subunit 3